MAPTTAAKKASGGAKKPAASHPTFLSMIQECVKAHPEEARAGVSRPTLKKFLAEKYKLDMSSASNVTNLNNAIKRGSEKGELNLPKGIGGRVKLAPKKSASAGKENVAPKKAATKAPVAKKSTTTATAAKKAPVAKKTASAPKPAKTTAAAPKKKAAAPAAKKTASATKKAPAAKAAAAKATTKKAAAAPKKKAVAKK